MPDRMPNATESSLSPDAEATGVRRLFPYARKLALKVGNRKWTRALAEVRWLSSAVRIVISLGLLYSIYLVSTRAIALWYFRQGTPE